MDAILDAGASGLQYFAVFLPRAALVADGTGTGELSATPNRSRRVTSNNGAST